MIKFMSIWCLLFVLLLAFSVKIEGQNCRTTGYFRATSPPQGQCPSNCCVGGTVYFTFQCSPTVTSRTVGILALRAFPKGGRPKCGEAYRFGDDSLVVALSTGWYAGGARCGKDILVNSGGRSVKAKVVDECDSTKGCEAGEGYHPPCGYNIVGASRAVWKALGVPQAQWGQLNITWSDA